ncbi:cationic trypsin-like [Teleopsis dalmanni]|uniref:cationic trypsin-like n=1 Tax=Teleopsis dalmanni TaxID=139649 RepID=UPI0018CC7D1F|nr:cationic trypsin-like [Teleopsis dalmanni]
MRYLIFFVTLSLCVNHIRGYKDDDDEDFSHLVVGGYRIQDNYFTKFMVSIRTGKPIVAYGDNHMCGGAIISKRCVVTAAHCLVHAMTTIKIPVDGMYVVAGSKYRLNVTTSTQTLYVKKSFVHPSYSTIETVADVGLLHLEGQFILDDKTVAAITIARETPKANTKCITGGWGSAYFLGPSPDNILYVNLQTITRTACKIFITEFEEGMICAVSLEVPEMDTCQGDSGGPLICDKFLSGIVSFGYECGVGYPGVYADVAFYRDWVLQNHAIMHTNKLSILVELLLIIFLQCFYYEVRFGKNQYNTIPIQIIIELLYKQ